MPGKWLAVISMAIVGTMIVAACGSDSSGGGGDSSSEASGGTIKVGTINAIGTKFNNDPARVAAVKAAAQAINEEGGINGSQIEVVFCNNGNEPNQGLACAQKLIKEGVVACVGCENDFNGGDVAQLFEGAGIPMVETEAIYPEEWNSPTTYLTSGGAEYQVTGTPLLAHELLDAKTYAYVGAELPSTKVYSEHIGLVAKQLGMEQVAEVNIPLEATNFDSYAAKIVEANPEVVMMITSPFQNIPLIKAIEGQGFHPIYLFNGDVPRNDDFKEYGAAANRIYVTGDVPPVSAANENKQVKEYVDQLESYRKKTGDTKETGLGESRMSSERVWLAMQFLKQVMSEQKGEVTASSLIEGLNSAKDLKSEMIPPWTPNKENCFEGYSRVSNPSIYFLKVENDQMVVADPKSYDLNKYLCK